MAQLTKIWTFDTGLEDWLLTGEASRITTDGSPGLGCIQTLAFGRNTGGTAWAVLSWTGTFASIGVPAGRNVTAVELKLRRKYSQWNVVNYGDWYSALYKAGALLTGLHEIEIGTGLTAWSPDLASEPKALTETAESAVEIRVTADLRAANNTSAAVAILFDSVELVVTYEDAAEPPVCTITNVTNYTLSHNATFDSTVVDFQFDKDITEWRVILDGVSHDTGTVLDSEIISVAANIPITVEILSTQLPSDGEHRINVYGNSGGLWTPYSE